MQPGLTHTRQPDLLAAAERLERDAYYVALVIREGRLELWAETEGYDEYALIMDDDLARQYADEVVYARLTVPRGDGSYETVVEDGGLTLTALRSQIPQLRDFELVEAGAEELPAQDPSPSVPRRQWMGLWFRSQSEVRIAEALDRANVLFAPNPSVRLGVTQDHRENPEPDFLVIANGKVGVLEVDGAPYHPPERADEHHERDRRFREHGIRVVERFSASDCYTMPEDVVTRFLRLLDLNG
jgi:hypothetical protein